MSRLSVILLQIKIISRDRLMDVGVCVRVIGNLSLIPEDVRKLIAEAMTLTKKNNKAFLNLAFSYTCKYNHCNHI